MPARIICFMVTYLVPNTIAWVGEAIGIMNAQLADNVAGNISHSGDIPLTCEMAASMGSIRVVTAEFELISVRNVITVQIKTINRISEISGIFRKDVFTNSDKPLSVNPDLDQSQLLSS